MAHSPTTNLLLQWIIFVIFACYTSKCSCSSTGSAAGSGGGVYGGRHSYSLTTFDPTGNLDQVVRAIRASTLGVPIVAVAMPPDDEDDVGADGRALCDIAIKLALDYRYLYGEEMPVAELLEGLAEKMQEMTMKGGARPFGCALLVGYLGDDGGIPSMYRVDPSGVVQLLTSYNNMQVFDSVDDSEDNTTTRKRSGRRGSFAFLGNWSTLGQKKDTIQSQLQNQAFKNEEEVQRMLVTAARQTFEEDMSDTVLSTEKRKNQPVLFIAFTRERSLQVSRVDSD
eukprot:g12165.t1 g12165   contig6:1355921-1357020(+)